MKKILLATALAGLLTSSVYAAHDEGFYVVGKGLFILGDDTEHGHSTLSGDNDLGFGIDLGYNIGHGFAIEYDFSYSKNDVTEKYTNILGELETKNVSGKYYTHAIDLVYTYEINEEFGIFGKAGYEYEIEKIKDLDIDNSSDGLVVGIGFEYKIDEDFKALMEYEHSTIDGPRGDGIFIGLMYTF